MTIGDRIKKQRLNSNFTLEYVAQHTGVSKQTIQRYESGTISNIPSDKIESIAAILNTTPAYIMGWNDSLNRISNGRGIKIPVLGKVVAGVPLEAIEDILDYEEIDPDLASTGDFFALQIQGNSMEPRIVEGDVVIVKKQSSIENGETGVILINGSEATVKKVKREEKGITLIAFNSAAYEPQFYSNEEIEKLPLSIIGKVVELRGKF